MSIPRITSRAACGVITTAAVSALLVALPAATSSAAPTLPDNCPTALPTDQAVDGVSGTGYTVEKGTKADAFTAKVLGRVTDGIAPGIDMIMADLDSPALERAGGVWAGMSGSPVYTADGKLIGSVSYGLVTPSNIAGITPAEDLLALRNDPSNARRAATQANPKIAVPGPVAERIAKTGEATKATADKGFQRLAVPISASGLATKNTKHFLEGITKDSGTAVRAGAGKAKSGVKSSPSEITAGSNYAAAFSYGDVSLFALGTTTYVCDDTAVAFGHPFLSVGPSDYSAHPAEAVYVQPDPVWGPFKVGNPGGPVGTVTWDGTSGIRSTLGQAPEHEYPVTTSLVNDQGKTVTGSTTGVYQPWAADVAALHLQAAVVKALGVQSQGSSQVKITVKGTRANGKKFKITHDDYFSDSYDISYATADSLYFLLAPLVSQPYEEVDITGVKITGKVSTAVKQYRVSSVQTKEKGKWIPLKDVTDVAPNSSIPVRATLSGYRNSDTVTVPLTVSVPEGTSGYTGTLTVSDGRSVYNEYKEPNSLDELLTQLNETPSGNQLVSQVDLDSPEGTKVTSKRDAEVNGAIAYYSTQVAVTVK
ncbi:SpoIVB peptidase S55 domain-containing protein [Kineosporia sp. NBRC 101731]|uniref:SpoIVB peptidase S55 domain-containing protein n=1 Tax=Kineosporia sp. NBRC 101731 TaxID=3032199 RepID=UPI0024A2C83C|nr:SpoIVB peptidase S55 domain-containing protein [Kineosporia sp. NBRC 101731]GLY26748.1 hypothetical protein Kisp02_01130 [Kineosporia sp. NBRC 101731]